MTDADPAPSSSASLPFDASLEAREQQADALLTALKRGKESARHAFKWNHPALRSRSFAELRPEIEAFDRDDARLVFARQRAFDDWASMTVYVHAVADEGPVRRFETAVEAVVAGDLETLLSLLRDDPRLSTRRSTRRHRAMLLHYLAANGVEDARQRTPANALAVARLLLDAGSDPDARAHAYGGDCTVLTLLVSSHPPAAAGLQSDLAALLVAHGAELNASKEGERAAVDIALSFGYVDTARRLVAEGAPVTRLSTAAGLGLRDRVAQQLAELRAHSDHRKLADDERRLALALAAQHGHADIVSVLLEAGEDPDRFNPPGGHPHSTPLHQAALAGHTAVVEVLLAAGARRDLRDTVYGGTPAEWARHAGHRELANHLDRRAGPTTTS